MQSKVENCFPHVYVNQLKKTDRLTKESAESKKRSLLGQYANAQENICL